MGSWWRSDDMTYVSFIIGEEAAPIVIKELGKIGCIQFVDLNPELTPFQRNYVSYIKRCDEIEKKIRFIHGEMMKLNITTQPGDFDTFLNESIESDKTSSSTFLLESLENQLNSYETQLKGINSYNSKLSDEYNHKIELHHLLRKSKNFIKIYYEIQSKLPSTFGNDISNGDIENGSISIKCNKKKSIVNKEIEIISNPMLSKNINNKDEKYILRFSNLAGLIARSDKIRFEKMIFRSSRGNTYIRFSPLNHSAIDANNNFIDKICFIIFFKSESLGSKITKICNAFQANMYDITDLSNMKAIQNMQSTNNREIADIKMILDHSNETRVKICLDASTLLEEMLWQVKREKATYHILNLFKQDGKQNSCLLRGQGWILSASKDLINNSINNAHPNPNLTGIIRSIDKKNWPISPTYYNINDFQYAFQEFVNTYGMPRYKEINPALFTAASFPFLFGVMYGDIGHGTCLMLAGSYLIMTYNSFNLDRDNKLSRINGGNMLAEIYTARYMLFAMGLMAMYAGCIYNDYFSLGLNIFGSNYTFEAHEIGNKATPNFDYGDQKGVYPIGVDPIWKISGNELLFYNSMKMKTSVIIGILQMTLGILLKGINCLYFKSYLDFFTEFLPCIIFDFSLFGYMIVLIFVKWSINWEERMTLGTCGYDVDGLFGGCSLSDSDSCYSFQGKICTASTSLVDMCPLDYGGSGDGCQPPNLITTLINIALKPGDVDEPMFPGQGSLQMKILMIAFICVPWLLFVKPLYLKYTFVPPSEDDPASHSLLSNHERDNSHHDDENDIAPNNNHSSIHDHSDGNHFDFSEIFIHQAIETIEFVLGMISNTASYLRLWALSLAHTELATVFWDKAMLSVIETNNPLLIFAGYAVFAMVTFGVLLAMDVLECFLHALRLHWVEFQNKFYYGDGYKFQPFDFKTILDTSLLE